MSSRLFLQSGRRATSTSSAIFHPRYSSTKPLYASINAHSSYILLHSPNPPTVFPAKFSTPLQRALQLRASKWGGMVNFGWFADEGKELALDDGTKARLTAFSALGGRMDVEEVTLDNVEDVAEKLKAHAQGGRFVSSPPEAENEVQLYVCTHGARDCRCGDIGGAVVRALREEVERRGLHNRADGKVRVRVGEVGHVGGHQFAANLLIFPHGEWLGNLTPSDVPSILDAILSTPAKPLSSSDPPMLRNKWRGRMGVGKDEMLEIYETSK